MKGSFLRALPGFIVSIFACGFLEAADLRDLLGLNKSPSTPGLENLSQDQVTSALKQALVKGVETAVLSLGRTNGFLRDPKVHIPLPDTLKRVETTLRAIGQTNVADEFVSTMNHCGTGRSRSRRCTGRFCATNVSRRRESNPDQHQHCRNRLFSKNQ